MPPAEITSETLRIAASAATGVAILLAILVFVSALVGRRIVPADSLIERHRLETLRRKSLIWRWFEPLAREWRFLFPPDESTNLTRLQLAIDGEPDGPPWKAAEFLEAKAVEGLLVGMTFGAVAGLYGGLATAVFVGGFIACVMFFVMSGTPTARMLQRRKQFVRRLPYAVDLLALMMEAGATFTDGLKTLVREQSDHPIGQEFARLLGELELGETQRAALMHLQQRLPGEEDVAEFVFAIVKGQELGTPLAQILRNQADQMRLKRSQRAEKAAADAQVKMTGPGFAIMLVCMAIITAPFAMNFWRLLTEDGGMMQ